MLDNPPQKPPMHTACDMLKFMPLFVVYSFQISLCTENHARGVTYILTCNAHIQNSPCTLSVDSSSFFLSQVQKLGEPKNKARLSLGFDNGEIEVARAVKCGVE